MLPNGADRRRSEVWPFVALAASASVFWFFPSPVLPDCWSAGPSTAAGRQAGRDELRLAHEGMLTDRFTRAVDQLGHEAPSVRCGGIFALERISRESPDNLPSIVQILTVTVLGRRAPTPRDPRFWTALDLTGVDLRRAQLQNADLRNARLRGANLAKAWLGGADLRGADLRDTVLDGAGLQGANADLTTWWPSGTFDAAAHGIHVDPHLVGADLRGAYLHDVDLTGVRLTGARADGSTRWPPGFDWRAAGIRPE